jgi:hypothetical protein
MVIWKGGDEIEAEIGDEKQEDSKKNEMHVPFYRTVEFFE